MSKRRANREGSIRQRLDGRWEAIVSTGYDPVSGKRKRVSFYGKTQKEVVDKATQARHQLHQGTYVDASRMTVGQWLTAWLSYYEAPRVQPLTLARYTGAVTRHLAPQLGHIPLQGLRPEQVEAFVQDQRRRKGLEPATIKLHLGVLSGALRMAEQLGKVPRNVCRLVKAPRLDRKNRQTLSMAQVRDQLLPTVQADRLAALYLMLFLTGVRRGELLGLRWQDVNLDTGTMAVTQIVIRVPTKTGPTKTRLILSSPKTAQSHRTISLPRECTVALRTHRARQAEERLGAGSLYLDHGLVFARPDGRPMDPWTVNATLTRTLKKAGLPHIRLHDCRHTYATWMLEAEVPMKAVSASLGHTSIRITADIYSHVTDQVARAAADRLSAAFSG